MPKAIPKSVTSLIDPSHPVISALGKTFGGYLPGKRSAVRGVEARGQNGSNINRSGVNPRVDIVDEKLCDDVLDYLAPTLEPYKGCTIIDAHPGACVWSRKLNDFLKPKRHILMEPEERYFETFIRPLLNQPSSTFRHTPQAAAHDNGAVEAFKRISSDQSLVQRPSSLPEDDPRLRQLDTSVLVTGNLARIFPWLKYHPAGGKASPAAHKTLQQLTKWASLSHHTFPSQGLVRMLWWLPDHLKQQVVPQILYQQSSFNVTMQMGAKMAEVIGVQPSTNYALGNQNRAKAVAVNERPSIYDFEISRLVRSKMDELGMKIPEGRPLLQKTRASSEHDADMQSPIEVRHQTIKGFKVAIRGVQDRCKTVLSALEEAANIRLPSKARKILGTWVKSIEYPQCFPLARDYNRLYPARTSPSMGKTPGAWERGSTDLTAIQARLALILDLHFRIINLEASYAALKDQGHTKVGYLKPEIIALDGDLQAHPISNRLPIPEFVQRTIAEQLAFFSRPPLLPCDRRPYEPLKADLESFWPRLPLALLDITPTGRDLAVPGIADRYEVIQTTSEIIKYLYTFRSQPLPNVLDKIAPNAAQDLIPQVPAMTDPRKGGRLNPANLRVRMLSEEMIEELVRAWFEWPFKPRLIDLALATDGGASEEGDYEGEGTLHEDEGVAAEA